MPTSAQTSRIPARHASGLDADLILVGGGLANGLIAARLAVRRPEVRLLLLEAGAALGGNHTWSFHEADVTTAQAAWLAPFVAHRWPSHSVAFPQRRREMNGGYASITSPRFDAVVRGLLGPDRVRLGARVAALSPRQVTLEGGAVLRAQSVIDGRGIRPSPHLELGHQKFLGQEIRLAAPHGLAGPVIMDATVAQEDGYRFVYVLPLASDVVLIEDTVYADGRALDETLFRRRIEAYALARGWRIDAVLREEQGVLPITLAGDPHRYWQGADGLPRSGLAAGLFHPATGYSLPEAVRLAELIAAEPDLSAGPLFDAIARHAIARWKSQSFFRLLNRMLFKAARPDDRWRVLQRFYGLPESLIARFYASKLKVWDKARILTGKPPVPIGAAVRAALARRPAAREEQEEEASP